MVGADIVEVAPAYDHAEITGIAAAHVAYELLARWPRPVATVVTPQRRRRGRRALAAHGVETVFGIPGTHNLELYRWFAATGIRHVITRATSRAPGTPPTATRGCRGARAWS